MSNDPMILTQVDMRVVGETNSTRKLIIDKLQAPPIKLVTAGASYAGGSMIGVEWAQSRLQPLEPKLSIKGVDLDAYGYIGERKRFVFAQAFKNKRTNAAIGARCFIEGIITEIEQDESDPEDLIGASHVFKEVVHYQYLFGGEELWYTDFFEQVARKKGKDMFADERRALGS